LTPCPPRGVLIWTCPPLGGMGGKRTKGLRAKGQKGDLVAKRIDE